MTLTEYLQSKQAREDVRALLADHKECPPGQMTRAMHGSGPHSWVACSVQQWTAVQLEMNGGAVRVYYRPDGDHIVTDLGEGVRALRLRTGFLHSVAVEAARVSRIGLEGPGEWRMGGDADIEIYGVTSANLPDAICRVMLASMRVAESTP